MQNVAGRCLISLFSLCLFPVALSLLSACLSLSLSLSISISFLSLSAPSSSLSLSLSLSLLTIILCNMFTAKLFPPLSMQGLSSNHFAAAARYSVERRGARINPKPSIRNVILGSYGSGWRASWQVTVLVAVAISRLCWHVLAAAGLTTLQAAGKNCGKLLRSAPSLSSHSAASTLTN